MKSFKDTLIYMLFVVALSGFSAFMAILVYFLKMLGVN